MPQAAKKCGLPIQTARARRKNECVAIKKLVKANRTNGIGSAAKKWQDCFFFVCREYFEKFLILTKGVALI